MPTADERYQHIQNRKLQRDLSDAAESAGYAAEAFHQAAGHAADLATLLRRMWDRRASTGGR